MRLKTLLIVLGLGMLSFVTAQELSPAVVSPAGDIGSTSTMSLEWTLGETAIETNLTGKNIYTEGFHQPVLLLERIEKIIELNEPNFLEDSPQGDLEIIVTPNPVQSVLHIRITSSATAEVTLQLSDLSGKTIMSRAIDPGINSADLDLSFYPSGLYLLQFIDDRGHLIQTHKVTKVQ